MLLEKLRVCIGLGLVTITFLLGGCNNTVIKSIPDKDIVFQTTQRDDGIPYSIGFVSSDGSTLEYLEIPEARGMPTAPVQTSDGEYLAFYGSYGDSAFYMGTLHSVTKQGKKTENTNVFGLRFAPIQNQHQIVAVRSTGGSSAEAQHILYSFDLDTNTVIEEDIYTTSKGGWIDIGTNALYNSNLLFSRDSEPTGMEIVQLDLKSGEERVIVKDSAENTYGQLYPAISPDGQWVAYTTVDGIYIISIDGSESRRIVNTCVVCEYESGHSNLAAWPPAASWSPDGQWIVYHRCTLACLECCESIEDHSIFKKNVVTGEEVLLVEGGLNPYWRLNLDQ